MEWLQDESLVHAVRSEGTFEGHELFSGRSGGSRKRRVVAVEHPKGESQCRIGRVLELFEGWQQGPAQQVQRVAVSPAPKALMRLGLLLGVMYRSDKWGRARGRDYFHEFDPARPQLCSDENERLHVVGGDYRITPDGIEG